MASRCRKCSAFTAPGKGCKRCGRKPARTRSGKKKHLVRQGRARRRNPRRKKKALLGVTLPIIGRV